MRRLIEVIVRRTSSASMREAAEAQLVIKNSAADLGQHKRPYRKHARRRAALNRSKAGMKFRPFTDRILHSPILVRKFLLALNREKKHLVSELGQVKGLMPLLMKPRNQMHWSRRDKHELVTHLQRLQHLMPYIAVFLLPGGMAMLPILAWWLDRRRGQRVMLRKLAARQS